MALFLWLHFCTAKDVWSFTAGEVRSRIRYRRGRDSRTSSSTFLRQCNCHCANATSRFPVWFWKGKTHSFLKKAEMIENWFFSKNYISTLFGKVWNSVRLLLESPVRLFELQLLLMLSKRNLTQQTLAFPLPNSTWDKKCSIKIKYFFATHILILSLELGKERIL